MDGIFDVNNWYQKFFINIFIYLSKVNNGNTRKMCEISLKFTIETERRSGAFIINLEHILQNVLVFSLLTLNKQITVG